MNFLMLKTDIFTNNVLKTKDKTFKNMKKLIMNKGIVILTGDKNFSNV